MAYIGKVPTAVPLSTNDLADNIITSAKISDGTITASDLDLTANYDFTGTVTGAGESGLQEVDLWRITSDISTNATHLLVSANLERVDTTGFEKIGTGMSVSSGTWTFPSTGYYFIKMIGSTGGANTKSDYIGGNIQTTTDNSTYTNASENFTSDGPQSGTTGYTTYTIEYVFKCSNVSTHKVRFYAYSESSREIRGDTNKTRTHFLFQKLGDI